MARERTIREDSTPALTTLRSIATAFEGVVRRYPRSGYADNALWQGAGVLQLAWETGGVARDRESALRLLTWLRRECPSSTLVRQIGARTTALNRPRPGATVARAASAAPRPAAAVEPPPAAARTTTPEPEAPARVVETPAHGLESAAVSVAAPALAAAATTGTPAPTSATAAPAATRAAAGAAVAVRGLSHTILPRGERLTLELSQEATFISAPGIAHGTVLLTVNDARAATAIIDAASRIRGTMVESVRLDNAADGLRVQVSLKQDARQSAFPLYNPNRLVFDFEVPPSEAAVAAIPPVTVAAAASTPTPQDSVAPVADREPSAHVPAASAAASSSTGPAVVAGPVTSPATPASIGGTYSLARQLGLGVSRIVIDPGHGGNDPGASGNGVTEGALTLDIALRLEKLLLAQPGFEVVLTRRTDATVALPRRTAIANEESADLFLSIHANSSPRRETAGVETYFLNLATNRQAEAVAARENASSSQSMRTLPQLVRAITNNNKLAESREFATAVQASMVRNLRPRNQNFQDLGVKQAPFVVLIGAQMPSVLVEVGFVTNRTEAGLVKQTAYKQQMAQALVDAILRYRTSLKKVSTVTASAEGR